VINDQAPAGKYSLLYLDCVLHGIARAAADF